MFSTRLSSFLPQPIVEKIKIIAKFYQDLNIYDLEKALIDYKNKQFLSTATENYPHWLSADEFIYVLMNQLSIELDKNINPFKGFDNPEEMINILLEISSFYKTTLVNSAQDGRIFFTKTKNNPVLMHIIFLYQIAFSTLTEDFLNIFLPKIEKNGCNSALFIKVFNNNPIDPAWLIFTRIFLRRNNVFINGMGPANQTEIIFYSVFACHFKNGIMLYRAIYQTSTLTLKFFNFIKHKNVAEITRFLIQLAFSSDPIAVLQYCVNSNLAMPAEFFGTVIHINAIILLFKSNLTAVESYIQKKIISVCNLVENSCYLVTLNYLMLHLDDLEKNSNLALLIFKKLTLAEITDLLAVPANNTNSYLILILSKWNEEKIFIFAKLRQGCLEVFPQKNFFYCFKLIFELIERGIDLDRYNDDTLTHIFVNELLKANDDNLNINEKKRKNIEETNLSANKQKKLTTNTNSFYQPNVNSAINLADTESKNDVEVRRSLT